MTKKNTIAAAKAASKRGARGKTPTPEVAQSRIGDRYLQNKETSKFGDHPDDHPDDEDGR